MRLCLPSTSSNTRGEAPLFRRLSENFELCVFGLNLVKQDLEEFQREYYSRLKEILSESPQV